MVSHQDAFVKGSTAFFSSYFLQVYRDGRMSRVVQLWQVGDWLDIRGPFGSQQYTPNEVNISGLLCVCVCVCVLNTSLQ